MNGPSFTKLCSLDRSTQVYLMIRTIKYLLEIVVVSCKLRSFEASLAEAYLIIDFKEIPDGIRYVQKMHDDIYSFEDNVVSED